MFYRRITNVIACRAGIASWPVIGRHKSLFAEIQNLFKNIKEHRRSFFLDNFWFRLYLVLSTIDNINTNVNKNFN
jgi:hypothetical protein